MKDKEIMRLVKGFTKGATKGKVENMCYMVCIMLSPYLQMCGLPNEMIEVEVFGESIAWGHWILRMKDGRIIDPTCDQFNIDGGLTIPKIYIGELPKEYKIL